MMRNRALRGVCRRIALTAVPVLLLTFVVGCPLFDPLPSPPEAVLAGVWTITPAEPGDFADFSFEGTFNADGQLTEILGTRAEDGATAKLDTTGSTTTLTGSDVTIDIPGDVMSRVFTGTLSEDENTMTGSVTEQINLGDVEFNLPGGDLTWTRVVADPCDGVECGEGQSCVDGECVDDAPAACDPECGEGQSCEDGECVDDAPAACDPECGEGQSCVEGECVDNLI